MWAQFGNSSMSMRGVIVASMLYEFDLENHFFLRGGLDSSSIIGDWHQVWPWNFTPVWQKELKLKVWEFFRLIFKFIEVKACILYFLSNFYFFIKWWIEQMNKNYEKCFLFHLKSSFHSLDIQIFGIQKGKWKWNNLWCHNLACINLQM